MNGGEIIIELGAEGGGQTVYGRRAADAAWVFWSAGTSMDFDENDDEVWRDWQTPEEHDLERVLPRQWLLLYPIRIHPEFVPRLRAAYAGAVAALPEHESAIHNRHLKHRWHQMLGLPDPAT